MKVAQMAGIHKDLIERAVSVSNDFESSSTISKYQERLKLKSMKENFDKLIQALERNNGKDMLNLWKKTTNN